MSNPYEGDSNNNAIPGLKGLNTSGEGVRGVSSAQFHGGVVGTNDNQTDTAGPGVYGESIMGEGVRGVSHAQFHGGVVGTKDNQTDTAGPGVYGESSNGEGVRGVGHSSNHGAVVGTNDNPNGIGVFGKGGRLAGQFEGDVEVTGKVTCKDVNLVGSDCAENFDIAGANLVEPGSVMVVDSEGTLRPCEIAYDKKVGGVISGAGAFKPGITLGKIESSGNRQPIALIGKVYCKVDADYGAIEVGDMLTTSLTLGHAMKAIDQQKAFGAVIGKALRSLAEGQDLIPILIALQ